MGCAVIAALVYLLRPSSGAAPRAERSRIDPRHVPSASTAALETSRLSGPADAGAADAASGGIWCFDVHTVDRAGHPIAGARVLATTRDEPPHRAQAQSGPDGVATVCVPSGSEAAVDARDDQGRWGRAVWWEERGWGEAESGSRTVVLFEPFAIQGRVIDERGAPIPGAVLYVRTGRPRGSQRFNENGTLTGQLDWTSDADGRFAIPIGVLGLYTLHAQDGVHLPANEGPIAARPGEVAQVSLVLRDAAVLRGTVSERGRRIRGAYVGAEGQAVYTDAQGAFTLDRLEPGRRYVVHIEAEGFGPLTTEPLDPGTHHFELERAGTLRIRSRVVGALRECLPSALPPVDREGVQHPAAAEVEAWRGDEELAWGSIPDVRHPLLLSDVPPGDVDIKLDALGFTTELRATSRSGAVTEIDATLALPDGFGVLVIRADPPPAPDEELRVAAEAFQGHARYGERGLCLAAPAGRHPIVVAGGGREGYGNVTVVAGTITDVQVTLATPPPVILLEEIAFEGPREGCVPRVTWARHGDSWIVVQAAPGTPVLLPGDRLLAADGERPREAPSFPINLRGPPSSPQLAGRDGTTVEVLVERPDGTTARALLTRACPP